jgi:hypothetical protein
MISLGVFVPLKAAVVVSFSFFTMQVNGEPD